MAAPPSSSDASFRPVSGPPRPIAMATPRTPIRTPAIRFHLAGSLATKSPETMTLMKAVLAFTIEARPPVTNCWPQAIRVKGMTLLSAPIIIAISQKRPLAGSLSPST